MPIDYSCLAIPKPPSRKTEKARKRKAERDVIAAVRAKVVARDGYCRVALLRAPLGPCAGESEWAHVVMKRFKTRGMPSHVRHTTAGTAMLCRRHHRLYDEAHAFAFVLGVKGMDGVVGVIRHG